VGSLLREVINIVIVINKKIIALQHQMAAAAFCSENSVLNKIILIHF
jgi:hypothetical protein